MQDRPGIGLPNELGIQVQIKIEPTIRFGVVDRARHQKIRRIMVPFGFNQARVKIGQLLVHGREGSGEDLEFLTTPAFDQRTTNQMINHLVARAVANRAHQAGDPRARARLGKTNAAPLQKTQDELEMLQLLDGDGVQLIDALEEFMIFFERDGRRGGLAFEVRMVDEDFRQIAHDFGQPIRRNFFAEQKHERRRRRSRFGVDGLAALVIFGRRDFVGFVERV